jgi:mRNA interferase MazF
MLRGEIWFVGLPFSSEREQSGERPAVVLQDAAYGQKSPLVLIALLTSQQSALRFPGTVLVQPSPTNGLTLPSVAMAFQARALDRIRFKRKVGEMEQAHLQAILDELQRLVGLTP